MLCTLNLETFQTTSTVGLKLNQSTFQHETAHRIVLISLYENDNIQTAITTRILYFKSL